MDDPHRDVHRRFDAGVESVSMPPEVTAALRAAGYRVRGPAGVGAGGPVWTAVTPGGDARGPQRVVVHTITVPAGRAGELVERRLDALLGLDHPHLAGVVDVLPVDPTGATLRGARDGSSAAVLVEEVPGTTLSGLLAARGPLSAGETVALTVPLAGALDTLHAAGLVHGDVSPSNIVVGPDGHPVLIDLLGGLGLERTGGRGTPGYVAPEVGLGRGRAGAVPPRTSATAPTGGPAGIPAGAPADVYGLATVAMTVLDPAQAGGQLALELEPARSPDPVLRPTAGELAAGCYARADPEPIALPDAGVLARTALAQLAGEARTVSMDRRSRSRHRAPHRRPTGVRRRRFATVVGAGLAASVVAAGWAVAALEPAVGPAGTSSAASGDRAGDAGGEGRHPDPAAAAVVLTHRRAEALTEGDTTALLDVVRRGSGAHASDVALLDGLGATGVRLEGLTATGVSAREVEPSPATTAARAPGPTDAGPPDAGPPDAEKTGTSVTPGTVGVEPVDVSVTSGLSAHRRVTPDGVVEVPAQSPRTVVLTLVWTPDGWRVESVRDP